MNTLINAILKKSNAMSSSIVTEQSPVVYHTFSNEQLIAFATLIAEQCINKSADDIKRLFKE